MATIMTKTEKTTIRSLKIQTTIRSRSKPRSGVQRESNHDQEYSQRESNQSQTTIRSTYRLYREMRTKIRSTERDKPRSRVKIKIVVH